MHHPKQHGPVSGFSGTSAVRPVGAESPHDDAPARRAAHLARPLQEQQGQAQQTQGASGSASQMGGQTNTSGLDRAPGERSVYDGTPDPEAKPYGLE